MKQNVSLPILIGAILLAVILVVFLGYHSLSDSGGTNIPMPGPIKQTEGMAPNPKPATIGSKVKQQ